MFAIKLAPFSNLEIDYTVINLVFSKIIPLATVSPFFITKFLRVSTKVLWVAWFWLMCNKTYDTTDHDILLQKLYVVGFPKHSGNWFWSYHINRTFLVNFSTCKYFQWYTKDLFLALYSFSYIIILSYIYIYIYILHFLIIILANQIEVCLFRETREWEECM